MTFWPPVRSISGRKNGHFCSHKCDWVRRTAEITSLLFDIVARCLRYVGEPVDVRSGLLGKGHVWAIISSVGLEMDEIKKENESWREAKIVTKAAHLNCQS
jgi:hypothetical protein